MVLSAMSLPYFYNYGRMFKSEDQAIKVMDLMRESAQLALNRRRTVSFQLDVSNPARPLARIIDLNGVGPDILIKTIPLEPSNENRLDVPAGITRPTPPNYPNATFASGVWTANFTSDGSVVNNAGIPISATLYSYPPNNNTTTPRRRTEVRAITIFGGSGAVRYWKHDGTTFLPFQ